MWKSVATISILLLLTIVAVADFTTSKKRPPYIVEKSFKNGSTIYLVATSHTDATKHPKGIENKVYKTIKNLFLTKKIDYLIVEGVVHTPIRVKRYIKYGLRGCKSNLHECRREQDYAVSLALKKDKSVVIQGGEPTYSEQLSYFRAHGYRVEDLIGLWTLKNTQKGTSKRRFKQRLEREKRVILNSIRSRVKFSFKDFKTWYKQKIGKDFDMTSPDIQIDYQKYFNPSVIYDKNYIKYLNTHILNHGIRDISLIEQIQNAIKNGYKSIAVIYGASHIRNIKERVFQ